LGIASCIIVDKEHRQGEKMQTNGWLKCPNCRADNIWRFASGEVWVTLRCGCGYFQRLARTEFLPDDPPEQFRKRLGTQAETEAGDMPEWYLKMQAVMERSD